MSEELETRHPPIGMGSRKQIEDLPDDVLAEIFTYLSFDDMINSVLQVSTRWHGVAQIPHVCRNKQYKPTQKDTDEDIMNILQQTPNLGILNLIGRFTSSQVLHDCLQICCQLRNLSFFTEQKFSTQIVRPIFVKCKKLEHLTLKGTFGNILEVLQTLGQLQKLKTLNIFGVADTTRSDWLRAIGDGYPMLQHLDISYQVYNTADLKYFLQMKQHQLQSIKVKCKTNNGRCTLPHLTMCKTLKELLIYELCDFNATSGFEALRQMKNITAMTFCQRLLLDVDYFVSLFNNKGMCHLIELKFDMLHVYEDQLSETICNNCPLLKTLHFINCLHLTDRSLENLHKLQELQYLNLNGCARITDRGMNFVFKCKGLRYLNLKNCTRLTYHSLKQLIGLNLLETLILDCCCIEGLPLKLFPTLVPKLRLLSLKFCSGVNLKGLNQLRAEMPHLTVSEESCYYVLV